MEISNAASVDAQVSNKEKICQVPSDMAIGRRIYLVRGEQVMIDRDLSELYGVENRALRQAVRHNWDKFPDDFLFKLTDAESNEVIAKGVSQSVIPPGYNTGGMQIYAFTEQGVAMLSTVCIRSLCRRDSDRDVLKLRPGITGPTSLKYRD